VTTATDLFIELRLVATEKVFYEPRRWPATPQHFSNELRRLGPDLRRKGIEVSFNATKRARQIVIERMPVERGNEE